MSDETEEPSARRKPRKEWFWADNKLIDEYAKVLGPITFGVYMVLARYANQNGTCFPSYETIAKDLGVARSTVVRSIKKLEGIKLITRRGRIKTLKSGAIGQTSNYYQLLPVETIKRFDAESVQRFLYHVDHPPKKRSSPAKKAPPKGRKPKG